MKISHPHTNTKSRFPKRIVIIAAAILALLAGAYLAYGYVTKDVWPFVSESSQNGDSPRSLNDVNYEAPTEEDLEESQNAKKNLTDSEQQDEVSTPQSDVSVGVTFSEVVDGNLEIRSFIPAVIEGSGTCTATLTRGSLSVRSTSDAFIDSSSSVCEPIFIPVTEFAERGPWSLVVTYTSSTSTGNSGTIEVII